MNMAFVVVFAFSSFLFLNEVLKRPFFTLSAIG